VAIGQVVCGAVADVLQEQAAVKLSSLEIQENSRIHTGVLTRLPFTSSKSRILHTRLDGRIFYTFYVIN